MACVTALVAVFGPNRAANGLSCIGLRRRDLLTQVYSNDMTSFKRVRSWAFVTVLAAGTLRCGGDNIEPPTASHIEAVAGDDQTGAVGETLGQPLVVKVTDDAGDPV